MALAGGRCGVACHFIGRSESTVRAPFHFQADARECLASVQYGKAVAREVFSAHLFIFSGP